MATLFDLPETPARIGEYNPALARQKRDEGINNAALGAIAHIGDDWPRRAYQAVKIAAERHPRFIVDAVWEILGVEPSEPRAMGAVMRRAVAEGLIEATSEYEASARVTAHRNIRRVWRSLVYQGGGE